MQHALGKLKHMVRTASDLTQEARELSERDRDYYDDHQLTAEEIATLRRRKQPIVINNRIKRKVDAMVGLEQRMRVDPKAFPRRPDAEDAADAATKALVFVDDNTRFDTKRSHVFETTIVEGYGGVEILAEQRRGKMEIAVNRLRWEEIFFDPYSREKDFSDATYLGTQKWMNIDAALEKLSGVWQGDEESLRDMLSATTAVDDGQTYEDRPMYGTSFAWSDRKLQRVRVAQMYYRSAGIWYLAIFCGGGEIYNEVSPYLDEDGNPTCPIILMTAYIDRENRRYGPVRSMIYIQDEINKRRSKLLHFNNSRQTISVKGAVDSVAALKRELADPAGHVEINIEAFEDAIRAGVKPFEVIPQTDQIQGQFALLEESKAEIDMFGPNPSLIGQTEGGASGRAIMAQQQAGMAELAPLYDSLRDWTIRCYRAMWERIRQFWTDERWVRVTDPYGRQEWLGINRVVGYVEVIDIMTGQRTMQPQIENQMADMDVDIVIDDVPDYVTLQQEQFDQLAQMAKEGIPIPPEAIIKASSVLDKAELLEMLETQREQAMQAQAQAMQAEQRNKDITAQAGAQRDMASAAKSVADAQKTRVETAQMSVGLR